ncbi:MAG: hypothetical protein RBR86_05520 [Pseudobdellovibrionaceae bacterium]|nr:hypothetical protein [Pseudobdellovibrionaceae bacterium]
MDFSVSQIKQVFYQAVSGQFKQCQEEGICVRESLLDWTMGVQPLSASGSFLDVKMKAVYAETRDSAASVHVVLDCRSYVAQSYNILIPAGSTRNGIGTSVTEAVLSGLKTLEFSRMEFAAIEMGSYFWLKFPGVRIEETPERTFREILHELSILSRIGHTSLDITRPSGFSSGVDLLQSIQKLKDPVFDLGYCRDSIRNYFRDRANAFCSPADWTRAIQMDHVVADLLSPKAGLKIDEITLAHLLLYNKGWSGYFSLYDYGTADEKKKTGLFAPLSLVI